MSLVIDTFDDLVQIIETHPEWRRRLKRALFDIDLEASLARLSIEMEKLATTQNRQADDIEVLKGDVSVLKSDVSVLKSDNVVIKRDLAELKGKSYENEYRFRASGIFGRFLLRGRDRTDDVAVQLHEAVAEKLISPAELTQVLSADMLWGGKSALDKSDIMLVLEASWRAELTDVERAVQRAKILRRIHIPALAVVAGVEWAEDALIAAKAQRVAIAFDGQIDADSWENAASLLSEQL